MSQYITVGKPLPRVDAGDKVTGRAVFGADVRLPGLLHAKVLGSAHAHADILHIDASRAEALPGVVAVVTAADLPDIPEYNPASRGHNFLARDRAFFVGQPVAIVVAEDLSTAEGALDLIEVTYRPLPHVLDPLEAMEPAAPIISHEGQADREAMDLHAGESVEGEEAEEPGNIANRIVFRQGDVAKGFAEADVIVENTYRIPVVHQGYIEPQTATASWDPVTRHLTVWVSTQGQFAERDHLAEVLNLSPQQVTVNSTEIGGGFGAKYGLIAPLPALASMKAGRPVRLVLTRHEDLQAANPAPHSIVEIKTGARSDGRLTALKARLVMDTGAYPGSPMTGACILLGASYNIPNLEIEGFEVLTNKASVGAYRAPGAPNAAFAIEPQIEEMARVLGMSPLEFRMKNAAEEGTMRPQGRPHGPIGLKQVLERLADHPIWDVPLGENQGRGMAIGGWGGGRGPASATVRLLPDGRIGVLVGSVDLTGTNTALAQIAAETLKVPLDHVDVIRGNTDTASWAPVSGGSQITYSMGSAVLGAAENMCQQLVALAAEEMEAREGDIEMADGHLWVRGSPDQAITFAELYERSTGFGAKYGPVVGTASVRRHRQAAGFAAHVADVEVDPETGKVTLLRLVAAQDVGFAINPMAVEGQMEGASIQGVGMALMEEVVYDERGYVSNPNLLDYRKPTAADVPFIETLIVEVPSQDGPFGAKQVGEPSIVPAPAAVANAVSDAVGVRMTDLPLTPERVWRAMTGQ